MSIVDKGAAKASGARAAADVHLLDGGLDEPLQPNWVNKRSTARPENARKAAHVTELEMVD
jgi:hypothetical protein